MNAIVVVAICAFGAVVVVALVWAMVKLNLAVLGKPSVEDKYPDEKFNLEWFCHNPPIPERNGRVFGVPARAAFEALACELQMPANQIEQMLGGCIVFGTSRNDHYKDVSGHEYTVKVEWARHKKLYGDKTKKGLNGMVGMECQGKF